MQAGRVEMGRPDSHEGVLDGSEGKLFCGTDAGVSSAEHYLRQRTKCYELKWLVGSGTPGHLPDNYSSSFTIMASNGSCLPLVISLLGCSSAWSPDQTWRTPGGHRDCSSLVVHVPWTEWMEFEQVMELEQLIGSMLSLGAIRFNFGLWVSSLSCFIYL